MTLMRPNLCVSSKENVLILKLITIHEKFHIHIYKQLCFIIVYDRGGPEGGWKGRQPRARFYKGHQNYYFYLVVSIKYIFLFNSL